MAKLNPFRFSTKYQDDETDLVYYGYRYLKDGRWLSRDPIGERGGKNLYACVRNNPITIYDLRGLDDSGAGESEDVGNASDYGSDWLLGTATDANFGQNSQWTKDMQRSTVVEIDRKRAKNELVKFCSSHLGATSFQIDISETPMYVDLGGELGGMPDSYPTLYYPALFLRERKNNPTAAFIGSWTYGKISVRRFDCCKRTGSVHFHAVNVSGWASATHYPGIFGYGSSLLVDNVFGEYGPGHNVIQTFDWDEDISF